MSNLIPITEVASKHGLTTDHTNRLLVVFGDHLAESFSGFWLFAFIERVNNAGGNAEMLYPPELGIFGNSHMLMQDKNSLQIADLIQEWIAEHVR
jgi:hypothetical protein